MEIREILQKKRGTILELAARHGVRELRLFGSVARGDPGPGSDIDFLVKANEGTSLFDLGGFLMDLEKLLGCEVDVVTEAGLRERIRTRVLQESVPL